MKASRLLSPLKHLLFGRTPRRRRIWWGAARGLVFEIDPDAKIQRLLGLDEREIQHAFVAASRWAEVFVDVGASDGYYGLVFHRHNRSGELHLIDTNPAFAELQRAHFALNFPDARPTLWSRFVVGPENPSPETCVLSRDLPLQGRRVFFKIDVDGWEVEVLRSAEALLVHTPCRFIIETHSAELERNCIALLERHRFTVRVVRPAWWRALLPEQRPIAHNQWLIATRP